MDNSLQSHENIQQSSEQSEVRCDQPFESLLQKIDALKMENVSLRRDLDTTTATYEKHVADVSRDATTITMLHSEILSLLTKMVSNSTNLSRRETAMTKESTPFVVVLIDGNRSMASVKQTTLYRRSTNPAQLKDEDVKRGRIGGHNSAQRIHNHLSQHLTLRKVFDKKWRLIIKFYASMSRLGTAYLKEDLVGDLATWRQFIDGFNDAFPFSYFVDAGDIEGQAHGKIQAQMTLFFNESNCKHTVLISSAKDVFTGFIRQYTTNDDFCGRITFIEAIPFPGAFRELVDHFVPAEKDGLFRKDESDKSLPISQSLVKPLPTSLHDGSKLMTKNPDPPKTPATPTPTSLQDNSKPTNQNLPTKIVPPTPKSLQDSSRLRHKALVPYSAPVTPTPATSSKPPVTFLSGRAQVVRRKPLAPIENQLPSPRNACFNSKGQRIDCMAYQSTCSERYLQC